MTVINIPTVSNIPAIIRRGSIGRVSVEFVDCDGNPVDASSLVLTVSCGDQPFYTEDFFQAFVPPLTHRIFKYAGTTGIYAIDWGDLAFAAQLDGVGGSYPTGFVGGETLRLQIDNTVETVLFTALDQTLVQVITKINSVLGTVLGQNVAFDNGAGQLRLISKKKGRTAFVVIMSPGTSASVAAALGMPLGTVVIGTERFGESSSSQTWLFEWAGADALHPSEQIRIIQTVHVLPGVVFQMLPQLRLMIDKVVKLVDPSSGCFLGYTDTQLLQYLIGGIQTINGYQPSIFFDFDTFPYSQFGSILIEAAMMWGVVSQQLFAVDTDVPSYSDQGASFVINHQQPLANYLNQLSARLDRNIPAFKLHFISTGSVVTEMGPNFRLSQLLSASPSGALFRNLFFRG